MARFLKNAIVAGVPFGLVMGLDFVLRTNLKIGTLQGVGAGVFFGLAIAAFSEWQHSRFTLKDGQLDGEPVLRQGAANHFGDRESVRGFLYLTDRRLVFRSPRFNVKDHEWRRHLETIIEVRAVLIGGFMPNGVLVKTDDSEDRFVVLGQNGWVDAIRSAMRGVT